MRIIAGTHGSRRLKTLAGATTRPTSDKIRGAIFSRLGPYFDGGSFLDVFGGSGAMAFEALSRGMDQATIIEKDPQAFKIISQNSDDLGFNSAVDLLRGDSINIVPSLSKRFDIVFLDPPYGFENLEFLMKCLIERGCLEDNGVLIVETDAKVMPERVNDWQCIQRKDYKTTQIYYYQK